MPQTQRRQLFRERFVALQELMRAFGADIPLTRSCTWRKTSTPLMERGISNMLIWGTSSITTKCRFCDIVKKPMVPLLQRSTCPFASSFFLTKPSCNLPQSLRQRMLLLSDGCAAADRHALSHGCRNPPSSTIPLSHFSRYRRRLSDSAHCDRP
jgi:hypothetical protein